MTPLDVFLTAVDGGEGKTRVAGLIARHALARGKTPGYLKPVETGGKDDARIVAAAAPGTVCATVYRFLAPLDPAVAARLQHAQEPTLEALVEATEELRAATDGVIVECSGGFLTPLAGTLTFADLAVAIALPVVIVVRPTLGCLNRAALTAEAVRRRGLDLAGIVINGCVHRPDLAERSARAELARIAPVLESIPLDAEPATVTV